MTKLQRHVLVVDDDAVDAELLRRQLALIADWNCEVVHVTDATGALAQLECGSPDTVFIDFHLGAKTGIELLKTLREAGYLMPIIMLTGHGSETIVKESLLSGADDYLDKNAVNSEILRRALQHAYAQSQRRDAKIKLQLTQFAIDHASDPVMWLGDDGRFSYVNEATCKLLDYSKRQALGLHVGDISSMIRHEAWPAVWQRLKQAGATNLEDAFRARDGSMIPVEVRLTYVHWKHIERCCAFVRDLRERKRAEAELREKAEQLRHKQRLEAVGALAGGVAHEFNNLLQAIRGFTIYAIDGLADDDQRRQDLAQVLDAAGRATDLTRQLLGFSRKQVLQRAACDPSQIVVDLVKMLRPVIGEHIGLVVSLDPDIGTVFADRNLLSQALLNLCINARDAMPDSGTLTLATARVTLDDSAESAGVNLNPGEYLRFTVSDTGCGMPPEVQQRVFEPFFTTKEIGKGTGLGLAMVYGSIQQHDGAILLDSEVGRGTTFTIYLPMVTVPEPSQSPRGAVPAAKSDCQAVLAPA
ncbi:MAG TPA: ATP-binding protein [Pirellulales bacterium]|nr:ATP-binding protein [Pirellulales bacterium]